jgi:hypothetical protein
MKSKNDSNSEAFNKVYARFTDIPLILNFQQMPLS